MVVHSAFYLLKYEDMSKKNLFLLEAYKRGYRISECGYFIAHKDNEKPQTTFNSDGYPVFAVRINKEVLKVSWHRLKAYQLYGEAIFEEGIVVRHLNSIKTDCSDNNIKIGTNSDNAYDKPEKDRLVYSLNAASKIRKYNATEVREYHINNGNSAKKTMEKFGITSKGTLHYVLKKAKHS